MAEPAKKLSNEELEKISRVPRKPPESDNIVDFNQYRRNFRRKQQETKTEAAQPLESEVAAEKREGTPQKNISQSAGFGGGAGLSDDKNKQTDQEKTGSSPAEKAGQAARVAAEKAGQATEAAGASMQAAGKGTRMAGKVGEKAGGLGGAGLGGAAGAMTGAAAGLVGGGPGGMLAGAGRGMRKGAGIGKKIGETPGKATQKAGQGMEKIGEGTRNFGRRFKKSTRAAKKNQPAKKEKAEGEKDKKVDTIGHVLFFGLLCFSVLIDILPFVTGGFSSILDWLLDFTFWFAISLVLFIVTGDIIGSLVGKRGVLNIIQTVLEFIPVIDALPIHTIALAIIYLDLQFGIFKIKRVKGAFAKIKKKLIKPAGK